MSITGKFTAAVIVTLGLSVLPVGTARAADEKLPKPIHVEDKVTVKATVEAIDKGNRTVTLKGPEGNLASFEVDESVKRFDALKVGDKITATYYESITLEIRRPGQPPEKGAEGAAATLPGDKPGGAVLLHTTRTVTIEAIDMAIPAVTVKTEDGNSVSFRVKQKKYLDGVKVGDQVIIVNTQALMIDVKGQE